MFDMKNLHRPAISFPTVAFPWEILLSLQCRNVPHRPPIFRGAAPAAPVSGAHPAARTPSISFPARLTPDGHRVSSLPAAARASTVQAALGGSASAGVAPKFWKPVPASPPSAFAPPAGFADAAPVRMGMSEEEIDAVDLGGALPS